MVDRLLGKKVIGIKQSTKAMKNGEGKILYVAKNANDKMVTPLVELAGKCGIEIKHVKNMKILGEMCGIDVKSAVALILD
ncbi:ribosomal L7Ae/L30e/S12e/Gadd45 family protein [Clostridium perfringens]|uniref:ribosomal L7Ae/L30e/S12e/Gadd45 family protein n=1 Tax=Clostridium perfringens TaxID=1502 RepID=UPI003754D137